MIITDNYFVLEYSMKFLAPLNKLIEAADGISKGNYDLSFNDEEVEEIEDLFLNLLNIWPKV